MFRINRDMTNSGRRPSTTLQLLMMRNHRNRLGNFTCINHSMYNLLLWIMSAVFWLIDINIHSAMMPWRKLYNLPTLVTAQNMWKLSIAPCFYVLVKFGCVKQKYFCVMPLKQLIQNICRAVEKINVCRLDIPNK